MAAFELKLPDLGEGIVEGEIVRWLVKEGDEVAEDQPLVEVMTDKATVVIPSPRRGRVARLHGGEGQTAKVHGSLVTLEVADEGAQAQAPAPGPEASPLAAGPQAKVLATPVTRRIARERGLDLGAVKGSGPNGRVLKADVLGAGDGRAQASPAPGKAEPAAPEAAGGDRRVPLRGLRRAIARKMVQSKFTAPHYTFVEELDATALKALRARLIERLAKRPGGGARLSFLPFIAKAAVAALREFPGLNANFDEAAQELVVRSKVNLGIAVASDEGLLVPVIKDAGAKTLRQLSEEMAALAAAARSRRARPEELSGGTFTITSLGEQGGLFATPIINYPEVAILGVHRMRPRPVVREGRIEIREVMYLSLSLDHRVVDGAVGAAFTYAVIGLLETPESLMLELR